MDKKDIVVGQKYRIVGIRGGCHNRKCRDCEGFYEEGIKIDYLSDNPNKVHGLSLKLLRQGITLSSACSFYAEDLQPLTPQTIKELIK